MNKTTKPVDLTPFCDAQENGARAFMRAPFSQDDFTWATNGKILVRVPRLPDVTEHPLAPHMRKTWVDGIGPWVPVTPFVIPMSEEECRDCDGTGKQHECPDCTCECEQCEGTGMVTSYDEYVRVGALFIPGRDARLILALPGLEIQVPLSREEPHFHFRFDGGEGMSMPFHKWVHCEPVIADLLTGLVAKQ